MQINAKTVMAGALLTLPMVGIAHADQNNSWRQNRKEWRQELKEDRKNYRDAVKSGDWHRAQQYSRELRQDQRQLNRYGNYNNRYNNGYYNNGYYNNGYYNQYPSSQSRYYQWNTTPYYNNYQYQTYPYRYYP